MTFATPAPAATSVFTNAFSGVISAIEMGCSAAIVLMGDESGNDPVEWFKRTGNRAAAVLPFARVEYSYFDDGNNRYAPVEVLREGPLGERYLNMNGSRPRVRPQAQLAGVFGDIDIRQKVAPANWVVASAQQLVALWGGRLDATPAGNGRSWMFWLKPNGANPALPTVSLSTDGNTQSADFSATVAPTVPLAGLPLWVRFTRVAATGAITFFTSSDGVAWTQLGAVVNGATGNTYATTEDWTLGGRGATTELFVGKIFDIEVRAGLTATTPIANTRPIESWQSRNDTGDTTTVEGSPTLHLRNGSVAGASLASHFDNATKRPLMLEAWETGICILSTGVNENTAWAGATAYQAKLDAWLAAMKARAPSLSPVVLTQHPYILPRPALRRDPQRKRAALLPIWAARNAVACIDTFRAFLKAGRPVNELVSGTGSTAGSLNGNDLLEAGTDLYLDAVWRALSVRMGG